VRACVRACTRACGRVHARTCYVVLFIQHETRMRHIVTSFLAPKFPPGFSILSHKLYYFRKKKVIRHKVRVMIFSTNLSKPFFTLEEFSEILSYT
jgi:hypothetical protein